MWVGNNPTIATDPTGGFSPIYGKDGKFLGTDSEGFKGEILIWKGNEDDFINGMSHGAILEMELAVGFNDISLSSEVQSNILTHILDYKNFDISMLHNGKLSVFENKFYQKGGFNHYVGFNDPGRAKIGKFEQINTPDAFGRISKRDARSNLLGDKFIITINKRYMNIFNTVENVVNGIGVHEFYLHGIKRIRDGLSLYNAQINHSSFQNTTKDFQETMKQNRDEYRH